MIGNAAVWIKGGFFQKQETSDYEKNLVCSGELNTFWSKDVSPSYLFGIWKVTTTCLILPFWAWDTGGGGDGEEDMQFKKKKA